MNDSPTVMGIIAELDDLRRAHLRLTQAVGENVPVWVIAYYDPLREEVMRWSNWDHDLAVVRSILVRALEGLPIEVDPARGGVDGNR